MVISFHFGGYFKRNNIMFILLCMTFLCHILYTKSSKTMDCNPKVGHEWTFNESPLKKNVVFVEHVIII